MNKQFHQLAPILALAQMPDKFRAFFIAQNYTEEQLKIDADIPDEVDKDNLLQDAEIHHAHSYKLREITDAKGNKHLDYLDGDCLQRLKGLAADAHDFYREGKLDMVRYTLAKMTHYRIDALTYPHLHKGRPWSKHHEAFETHMGHFIVQHAPEIGQLKFEACEDIYKAARVTALAAWYEGRDLVELYEQGKCVPDETALMVCKRCVQAVGSLWITLAQELKILEVENDG